MNMSTDEYSFMSAMVPFWHLICILLEEYILVAENSASASCFNQSLAINLYQNGRRESFENQQKGCPLKIGTSKERFTEGRILQRPYVCRFTSRKNSQFHNKYTRCISIHRGKLPISRNLIYKIRSLRLPRFQKHISIRLSHSWCSLQ